ncbi:uncharacterized protein [Diadema setosum]|uniref:uncharacterized protein n=1 Tax=Diadema setosum TaxID=31175 RepID=UPI003B3BB119
MAETESRDKDMPSAVNLSSSPPETKGDVSSGDAVMEDSSLHDIKLMESGDSSNSWISPDGAFTKDIVEKGSGFTSPNDGARCHVTIEFLNSPAFVREEIKLGYPPGESDVILGNGCEEFSEVVDACLETMHKGERCKLSILRKQNEDRNIGDTCRAYDKDVLCSISLTLHDFSREREVFQMSTREILERVSQLKSFGTQCFKEGKQQLAEKFYIRALRCIISICHPDGVKRLEEEEREEYCRLRRTCSLNLAACQLKHKRYSDVITHCTYALEGDPENTKALYRRCQAYLALDEFECARADIQTALANDPKSKLFLEQHRLLVKREKQVYSKLSAAMTKMFGGST